MILSLGYMFHWLLMLINVAKSTFLMTLMSLYYAHFTNPET